MGKHLQIIVGAFFAKATPHSSVSQSDCSFFVTRHNNARSYNRVFGVMFVLSDETSDRTAGYAYCPKIYKILIKSKENPNKNQLYYF